MFDNSIWCVHICAPRCENCNELKCHSQTHQFLLNRSVDVSCQHQVKSIHLCTECFSFFIILTTVAVVILFGHINSAQAMLPFAPLCVCFLSLFDFKPIQPIRFISLTYLKGFLICIVKWTSLYHAEVKSVVFVVSVIVVIDVVFVNKNSWLQLLLLLFSLNGHWHFWASKAWCWLGSRYDYPSLSRSPLWASAVCCTGICFSYDIHFIFFLLLFRLFIYFLTKMKWYQIGFKCVAFVFHELWYVLLYKVCMRVCMEWMWVNAFHVFYTQS